MMPVEFAGQSVVFAKDQPEYMPLPAHVGDTPEGVVTCCWELGVEEIAEIARTGRIWVQTLTFRGPLQPISLSVTRPADVPMP